MKKLFFIPVLCLFIIGCETTTEKIKLVSQVLPGQRTRNEAGGQAIMSHKRKASAFILPQADTYSSEDYPTIFLGVYCPKESFDFSTEDIQVFVDDNPHRVLRINDLAADLTSKKEKQVAEIESRYEAQSEDVALRGYTASEGVGSRSASRRYDTEYRGSGGSALYSVETVAEGQSNLEVRKRAELDAIELKTSKAISALDAVMLKKTTVPANTWYRRWVALGKIPNPDRSHKIKLIVLVAGEKHEFLLNQVKTH